MGAVRPSALRVAALAGLHGVLACKGERILVSLVSGPVDDRRNQMPAQIFHDWQRANDREAVTGRLAAILSLDVAANLGGALQARELEIRYTAPQLRREGVGRLDG